MAPASKDDTSAPIIIKKYANRRLYDTSASCYVTLENLAEMVRQGTEFTVIDAKSGEDITRSVLTQIIFDAESRGENVLPLNFLRQVIALYGDSLQNLLPGYLDMSMDYFTRNQTQMRDNLQKSLGGMDPFSAFEEISRNNMAMFEKAMSMFNPYMQQASRAPERSSASGAKEPSENGNSAEANQELDTLRAQMAAMQEQLNRLSRK